MKNLEYVIMKSFGKVSSVFGASPKNWQQSGFAIMGCTLANNVIVAAGSVVTKSFLESNIIIGGNPAKKITTWEASLEKNMKYAQNIKGLSAKGKKELLTNAENILRNR